MERRGEQLLPGQGSIDRSPEISYFRAPRICRNIIITTEGNFDLHAPPTDTDQGHGEEAANTDWLLCSLILSESPEWLTLNYAHFSRPNTQTLFVFGDPSHPSRHDVCPQITFMESPAGGGGGGGELQESIVVVVRSSSLGDHFVGRSLDRGQSSRNGNPFQIANTVPDDIQSLISPTFCKCPCAAAIESDKFASSLSIL